MSELEIPLDMSCVHEPDPLQLPEVKTEPDFVKTETMLGLSEGQSQVASHTQKPNIQETVNKHSCINIQANGNPGMTYVVNNTELNNVHNEADNGHIPATPIPEHGPMPVFTIPDLDPIPANPIPVHGPIQATPILVVPIESPLSDPRTIQAQNHQSFQGNRKGSKRHLEHADPPPVEPKRPKTSAAKWTDRELQYLVEYVALHSDVLAQKKRCRNGYARRGIKYWWPAHKHTAFWDECAAYVAGNAKAACRSGRSCWSRICDHFNGKYTLEEAEKLYGVTYDGHTSLSPGTAKISISVKDIQDISQSLTDKEKLALIHHMMRSMLDPVSALDEVFRKVVQLTHPVLSPHLVETFIKDMLQTMDNLIEKGKSTLIQNLISALQPVGEQAPRLPPDRMPFIMLERIIRFYTAADYDQLEKCSDDLDLWLETAYSHCEDNTFLQLIKGFLSSNVDAEQTADKSTLAAPSMEVNMETLASQPNQPVAAQSSDAPLPHHPVTGQSCDLLQPPLPRTEQPCDTPPPHHTVAGQSTGTTSPYHPVTGQPTDSPPPHHTVAEQSSTDTTPPQQPEQSTHTPPPHLPGTGQSSTDTPPPHQQVAGESTDTPPPQQPEPGTPPPDRPGTGPSSPDTPPPHQQVAGESTDTPPPDRPVSEQSCDLPLPHQPVSEQSCDLLPPHQPVSEQSCDLPPLQHTMTGQSSCDIPPLPQPVAGQASTADGTSGSSRWSVSTNQGVF